MENLAKRFGRLITVEDFLPYVGHAFRVQATPKPIEVRLENIKRQAVILRASQREPFTLIFSTPFAVLLIDGTYRMHSPDGREFSVDLIPTQVPPGERRYYHAVFN